MVGQVGLEPTTALSTEFTVRGDTNYAVLTHIRLKYMSSLNFNKPAGIAISGE